MSLLTKGMRQILDAKIPDSKLTVAQVAQRLYLKGEKLCASDPPDTITGRKGITWKSAVVAARGNLERFGYVFAYEEAPQEHKGRAWRYWYVTNLDHQPNLDHPLEKWQLDGERARAEINGNGNGEGRTKRPYKRRAVQIPAPLMRSTLTVGGVVEEDDGTIQVMLKNDEGRWWVLVQGFTPAGSDN